MTGNAQADAQMLRWLRVPLDRKKRGFLDYTMSFRPTGWHHLSIRRRSAPAPVINRSLVNQQESKHGH